MIIVVHPLLPPAWQQTVEEEEIELDEDDLVKAAETASKFGIPCTWKA
jgi:hypothetical protein